MSELFKYGGNSELMAYDRVPEVYSLSQDVRITLLTSCQSGCSFCHAEGHNSSSIRGELDPKLAGWKKRENVQGLKKFDAAVGPNHVEAIIEFVKICGFKSVHLTGGEPSLHPNVLQIISNLSKEGIKVGMTSHGEYDFLKIAEMVAAGLKSLNVSLHAVTPEHYLAMDLVAQNIERNHGARAALRYSNARLNQKRRSLIFASELAQQEKSDFRVKINCVVEDYDRALAVLKFCATQNIMCRFQANNKSPEESRLIIEKIISQINARPVVIERSLGDSSSSGVVYKCEIIDDGGMTRQVEFKVKNFDKIFVQEMCDQCNLKNRECSENFYGIRLELGSDDRLMVRLCIDKSTLEETLFSIEDFLRLIVEEWSVPHGVLQSYRRGVNLLWKQKMLQAYTDQKSELYSPISFEPSMSDQIAIGSVQHLQFDGDNGKLSGWYFLANETLTISLEDATIFAVTPDSALGSALQGKRKGDFFTYQVNGGGEITGSILELV